MINKKIKIILVAFVIGSNIALFQNCSKVVISPIEKIPEDPIAELSLKAQACANAKSLLPEKTKFVFVIDLSQSNLGVYQDTSPYHFLPQTGTDPTGKRFDALIEFINTCGAGSDTEYAIINFSDISGSLIKNGRVNTLTCSKEFYSGSEAQSKLQAIKALQAEELAKHSQFVAPNPYDPDKIDWDTLLFNNTNYVAAADCLSKTIETDMTKPTAAINYQVFFISDGEAYFEGTGCEENTVTDKVACYTSKMEDFLNYTMKLGAALTKQIRIHALYYSLTGASNSSIESYMKYLSTLGQTKEPINIGNISNSTAANENPFCNLLAVDRSIVFKTTSIMAINKNAVKMGARLYRDSDSDGIIDNEEINTFNSNPDNPRSMVTGVLDGVCKMIGSKQLCKQERAKVVCSENQINNFGIGDCDIKLLKLNKITTNANLLGVDSDNDGIPDYVEILKGTNPLTADGSVDMDSDGYTNLEEIANGTDPFTPDEPSSGSTKYQSNYKTSIDQCSNGGWAFSLNSLKALQGKNEITFFFKTISTNSTSEYEFKYKNIKLIFELDAATNTLIPQNSSASITPTDFELIQPGAF